MIEVTMWLRNHPEIIESREVDPSDGFEDLDIDDTIRAFCVSHGVKYTPDAIERHVKYSVNYAA